MTPDKTGLKSCPFCGEVNPSLMHNSECDWWYLHCDKCSASVGMNDAKVTVSANAEYEIDEYEDCMEFYESGDITGLEPLFERWNTRTETKG